LGRTCREESTLLQAASKRSGAASGGGRPWSGCRTADRPSRPRGRVRCWSLLHAPTRQISSASWRTANQSQPMPSTVRTTVVGKIAKLMPRTRRRLSDRASPARSQAERPRPATGRGAPPGRRRLPWAARCGWAAAPSSTASTRAPAIGACSTSNCRKSFRRPSRWDCPSRLPCRSSELLAYRAPACCQDAGLAARHRLACRSGKAQPFGEANGRCGG